MPYEQEAGDVGETPDSERPFTYRLRAAAYHGEEHGSADAAARQALLTILQELGCHDSICVEMGKAEDAGDDVIDWSLAGRCRAPNAKEVAVSLRRLHEVVHSAFRSVPELDLASTPGRAPRARGIQSLPLYPAAALVSWSAPGQRIGFSSTTPNAATSEQWVALPLAVNAGIEVPGLISSAARLPVDTRLRFTFRRLLLDDVRRAILERLLDSIQRDALVGCRLGSGVRLSYEALQQMRGYWEPLLKDVLIRGSGCLVHVTVLAPRFAAGTRSLLSALMWPGVEATGGTPRAGLPPNVLHLGCLLPGPWFATRLVPSCRDLGRLAFPASFRVPLERPKSRGMCLGHAGGRPVALGEDERARHLYILGATGTGKTTLLGNCVKQAIAAGEGVALLDPHGDLIADVLRWLPPDRVRNVVLFDPSDCDRAPGLNLLDAGRHRSRAANSIIANEMVDIFRRLYRLNASTGGPVFEQYVRNAILLLIDNDIRPPLTLCEVPIVFESPDFRMALLRRCSNPYVVAFWRDQAERITGENALRNMGPYITSKMNQFTHNPLIRSIVGQSSATIDFRKYMDEGKILLCNLTKGSLGAYDVKLLGMLLTTKLLQAALSRADLPPQQRRPFSLFIDEFQNFVSDSVAQGLSEARKFGLRLVLANQHLGQLEQADPDANMATAVLGNAANLVLFRLGPRDAAELEVYTRPQLTAADLQFLPDFHAAARILRDGRPLRPFVLRADPPTRSGHSDTQFRAVMEAIGNARTSYARPVDVIEREIADRRAKIEGPMKEARSKACLASGRTGDSTEAA